MDEEIYLDCIEQPRLDTGHTNRFEDNHFHFRTIFIRSLCQPSPLPYFSILFKYFKKSLLVFKIKVALLLFSVFRYVSRVLRKA